MPSNREKITLFCDTMDEWADLIIRQQGDVIGFPEAWGKVRLAIRKSCLLDRTMSCGEKPSQTPCPVHQGHWAGCHFRWPGRTTRALIDHDDHKAGDVWLTSSYGLEREWYDAGCRCAYHLCGCTTGWQPDEHCGCGGEDRVREELKKLGLEFPA